MDLLSGNICRLAYVILLAFVNCVTSHLTCAHSGKCATDFFCHTGLKICVSCYKCSEATGNFNLCKGECFPPTTLAPEVVTEKPPTVISHKYIVIGISVCLALGLIAVVASVIILIKRRRRTKNRGIMESGPGTAGPSQMKPTETNDSLKMNLLPNNDRQQTQHVC